ncbi:hypothetical protein RLOC_00000140 [Lonchura striata]|uniref:Uncharacterized protein n=2 Tax=Lonchura striata TaxID=40157 RepID=A0A218U7P4_9PASE|nr:hypothetical protein RLOC_00000140 [Lonchura striata domestica]
MHQKGKSMLIQSNFKLKVLYKWDDHVVIKLPAALSGKVCGMCRNNRDLWDHALCLDGKQLSLACPTAPTACLPTCNIPTVSSRCSTVNTCVDTCVALMPTPALPPLNVAVSFKVSSMALARNFGVTSLAPSTLRVMRSGGRQCARILVVPLRRNARWSRGSRIVIPKFLRSAPLLEPLTMRPLIKGGVSSRGCVSYLLVGLCEDTQNLVGFQVLVQNGHQSDNLTLSIAVVTVKSLQQNHQHQQEHRGKIMTNESCLRRFGRSC